MLLIPVLGIGFLAGSLICPNEAGAHGVYIFGWGEGGQICTDSYFSRKSKVQGGTVRIKDESGAVLAEGLTDDQGEICFPRPKTAGDLLLEVEAGEGHRAEFTLRAGELPPLEESSAPIHNLSQAVQTPGETDGGSNDSASALSSGGPDTALLEEKIKGIVREELKNQLSPLNRLLAENRLSVSSPPTFRDIFGGLGWLAGVFGLAFWITGRKRQKS